MVPDFKAAFATEKATKKKIYVENNKRGALLTLTTMNFQAAAVAKAKVLVKRETLHLYLPYLIHLSRRDLSLIDSMSHRFDSSSRGGISPRAPPGELTLINSCYALELITINSPRSSRCELQASSELCSEEMQQNGDAIRGSDPPTISQPIIF